MSGVGGGREAPVDAFGFDIFGEGAGDFVLTFFSMDGVSSADTWHETLGEAYAKGESFCGSVAKIGGRP